MKRILFTLSTILMASIPALFDDLNGSEVAGGSPDCNAREQNQTNGHCFGINPTHNQTCAKKNRPYFATTAPGNSNNLFVTNVPNYCGTVVSGKCQGDAQFAVMDPENPTNLYPCLMQTVQ